MQCFICVMYAVLSCAALPALPRSLFHDVITALTAPPSPPDRYGHHEPRLPADTEFIPRRNDRIEMPTLKRRIPKSFSDTTIQYPESEKEEVILYIQTTNDGRASTSKPKKPPQKKPAPANQKVKLKYSNKNEGIATGEDEVDDEAETVQEALPALAPLHNNMSGQSHIGHRESQVVVKPTVIVNFRGTITHRDSDIKLEGRYNDNSTGTPDSTPDNVFNINQEINLERPLPDRGRHRGQTDKKGNSKDEHKPVDVREVAEMLFETEVEHDSRKYNLIQKIRNYFQH